MDNNADTALIISIVAAAVAGIGLIVSIASATYTRRQAAAAERSAAADEIAARAADAERRAREEAVAPRLFLTTDDSGVAMSLGEDDVLHGQLENRGPSPAVVDDVELSRVGETLTPLLRVGGTLRPLLMNPPPGGEPYPPVVVEPGTPLELQFPAAGVVRFFPGGRAILLPAPARFRLSDSRIKRIDPPATARAPAHEQRELGQ